MTDATLPVSPPKKQPRWLRWLAYIVAGLMVLAVAAYLVVTSSAFIKGVILPRIGAALNATVTASSASLQPFHQLVLRDLKVQANGTTPPLVTADEVTCRYHLWAIIHGNLRVDEVALVSPTVELVENPDGTSNLDPIMKALQGKPAAEKKPAPPSGAGAKSKPAKPQQIELGKLTLSNAHILKIKNYDASHRDSLELTKVNVTLTNLKNGETAKLELAASLSVDSHPPAGPEGSLAASLNGSFECAFDPDLKPATVNGSATLTVSQAGGAFGDFSAFSTALQCDVTPAEIKQLSLRFQQAGASLGELAVSGPLDPRKMEGQLTVDLRGIDRRLLNLAAAKSAIDFGTTTLDATAQIQLARAGSDISATGKFNAAKVQLTRAGQTTPALDFSASYDVAVDRTAQTATLRSLNLTGTQNGASLMGAQLTSPMSFAWGSSASSLGDAALNLTVTGLNLADWQPFLNGAATAGNLGLKLTVTSHQGGKQILFDLDSKLANLNARLGSNQISQAEIDLSAKGQAEQFKHLTLDSYKVDVALQNQPALNATGSGVYDLATGGADLQVKLQATLAPLLQAFPRAGISASSGELAVNAHVVQKEKAQSAVGDLSLDNFSGQIGKNAYQGYSGKLTLDVANSPEQIQINKLAGNFSQNGKSGGVFAVFGTFLPTSKSADLKVRFSNLNENGLRPFLEPLLAGKQLTSVSISGDISGQYHPQGASQIKADVQISKLVVTDPKQPSPATPLAAGLEIDASLDQQTANVRQFQLALTPTDRAANQLQFSGQLDFSKPGVIQGQLGLGADSLDLTGYYDLFSGGSKAGAKTTTTTAASPAPAPASAPAGAGQETEPAAVHLPLSNFGFTIDIGKIYLHEIAITNFQTTANIDGSHIVLNPFQLALNGAPVDATADLDLGVPGYKYKVGFHAKAVPLAPLVNTFQPQRAGQFGGTLTASAQINGAGITGASLQKNLAGQFDVGLTNINLSIDNVQNPIIKLIINVVATVPQLVSSPESAIATLVSGIFGQGALMAQLKESPINIISAEGTVTDGRINLQDALLQSAKFEADAAGVIQLKSELTNSTVNIPVTISLSQDLAKQMSLASNSSNTYVPLPKFLTITGTLGKAKPNIDRVALTFITAKSLGRSVLKNLSTNSAVGNALKNVLSTNSPAGNLLNQFLPH